VRFEGPPGRQELIVSNLDKLEEPASLVALREHVAARLPRVDLPEVLLEVHSWTGFADEFVHISTPNAQVRDFAIGSDIHVMLALCCSSHQVVMADEQLDGPDMVRELFGEGQCLAHQA
jgi:hypothetical protein